MISAKKLLPGNLEGKILSVLGYLSVVMSLFLSYNYFSQVFAHCLSRLPGSQATGLVYGIAELGIAVSLFFAVWGLRKREHMSHAILTFALIVIISVVQLLFAAGMTFTAGIGCRV